MIVWGNIQGVGHDKTSRLDQCRQTATKPRSDATDYRQDQGRGSGLVDEEEYEEYVEYEEEEEEEEEEAEEEEDLGHHGGDVAHGEGEDDGAGEGDEAQEQALTVRDRQHIAVPHRGQRDEGPVEAERVALPAARRHHCGVVEADPVVGLLVRELHERAREEMRDEDEQQDRAEHAQHVLDRPESVLLLQRDQLVHEPNRAQHLQHPHDLQRAHEPDRLATTPNTHVMMHVSTAQSSI
eukprot:3416284-Rhodomonas_salina.2